MRNLHSFNLLLLCMLSALLLKGCCRYHEPEDDTIKRTVLVYVVAENSLCYGDYHKQDMDELDVAVDDIPSNCRLVVYVDDDNYPYIYVLQKDKNGQAERKTLLAYEEDRVSTSKEQLSEAINYVRTLYPSDGYGLVYWSHGSAWLPATRSIGIDNGSNTYSNNGDKMEISALAEVLEQYPALDFLMFDACFMQSIEVDWTLRKSAKYIIASPAEIPGPGAPYQSIVAPMFASSADVEGIIDAYYHCYADTAVSVYAGSSMAFGALLSVVQTDALENLQTLTKQMLDKYVVATIDDDLEDIQRYNPITSSARPEYYDMNGYMRHLITSDADYTTWRKAFDKAVPYRLTTDEWYSSYNNGMNSVNRSDYGGVSMFVPQSYVVFQNMLSWFRGTSWYTDSWSSTGW